MSKQQAEAAATQAAKVIIASLREWRDLSKWLADAKPREAELREQLADFFIPPANRTEGINTIVSGSVEIKVDHKINRTIDEAALDAVMPQLPEAFRELGVLIAYKPSLVKSGLDALSEQERIIFGQAMTEKPGLPALSIKDITPEDAGGGDPSKDLSKRKKPAKKAAKKKK